MSVRPGLMAGIAGGIGLVLWLLVFAAGMTIDSTPLSSSVSISFSVTTGPCLSCIGMSCMDLSSIEKRLLDVLKADAKIPDNTIGDIA